MPYDPFAFYDNENDGSLTVYGRDDEQGLTPGRGSFLRRACYALGDWRHYFPVSSFNQLRVFSNWGSSAIFGVSRSSLNRSPKPGAMETYGAYVLGIKDDTHAMDAGGIYAEGQQNEANGCVAAGEFSIQVKEGLDVSIPDPFEQFTPGREAHAFGAFFSTSGTRWPYATNVASAAAYIVASFNALTGRTAGFNRGIVFGADAINEVDGHRRAHFLAAGQSVAWMAQDGKAIDLTSDGEELIVVRNDKRFRVALTPV